MPSQQIKYNKKKLNVLQGNVTENLAFQVQGSICRTGQNFIYLSYTMYPVPVISGFLSKFLVTLVRKFAAVGARVVPTYTVIDYTYIVIEKGHTCISVVKI